MANNQEFLIKGAEFIKTHPDFNERMEEAHRRGFDMDPAASDEIERLAAPELLYWLTSDEYREGAHTLKNLVGKPEESRQWIKEKAAQLKAQGYERVKPTDEYLRVRGEALRSGLSVEEHLAARGARESLSATDRYILERKLEKRGR